MIWGKLGKIVENRGMGYGYFWGCIDSDNRKLARKCREGHLETVAGEFLGYIGGV